MSQPHKAMAIMTWPRPRRGRGIPSVPHVPVVTLTRRRLPAQGGSVHGRTRSCWNYLPAGGIATRPRKSCKLRHSRSHKKLGSGSPNLCHGARRNTYLTAPDARSHWCSLPVCRDRHCNHSMTNLRASATLGASPSLGPVPPYCDVQRPHRAPRPIQ